MFVIINMAFAPLAYYASFRSGALGVITVSCGCLAVYYFAKQYLHVGIIFLIALLAMIPALISAMRHMYPEANNVIIFIIVSVLISFSLLYKLRGAQKRALRWALFWLVFLVFLILNFILTIGVGNLILI